MLDFKKIEQKWQKKWEKNKIFEVKENKGKKFYCLEMFPYPSASGLHMGHAFNYTIGDCYARFKRMQGFNVLYPMGYDSLGLPAENAAIKEKVHPKKFTEKSISNFIKQQKTLGLSYDWSRIIATHKPEYYKWNQYFFLKFLENDLVYRKKASVNWCPKCNTVLANEQVHNGKCWRHEDTDVEVKQLEQWFIKTTKYADELLKDIEKLEWPERIKIMQKNWIGKSYGLDIDFEISDSSDYVLLHGFTGSPNDNFFPWLKKELENRGYKVTAPQLPNSNNPKIMEQVNHVLKNEKFNENTVLLGHSLGVVVALKVVESLKHPIKKLVLAAGFLEPKFKDKRIPFEKTFDWKFDFDKIRKNVKEVVILRASNDSVVPGEQTDKIKEAIGGTIIDFKAEDDHITSTIEPEVLNHCLNKWSIFTTRPDTIYGVTFMVISAQHPRLMEFVTDKKEADVEKFLKKIRTTSGRDLEELEKAGVFTGSYAINPLTDEKIPIYVGNFVVAEYGSGMVMAVPAHDQRDFEFAKKYNLPIKVVIQPPKQSLKAEEMAEVYTEEGNLVNSGEFTGMNSKESIERISDYVEKNRLGKRTVNYKLRDWLISRQRYWGTPIPAIYCDKCGVVTVPEKDLPVILPEKVRFGKGNPLETNKDFVDVKCPKCKGKAKRETDTMDTFFDSSWYFLRYCDNENDKEPFDKKKVEYWMPVDQYIGGAEHACMHLIYVRFFIKALRDLGFLKFDEPFIKLFNQGMLHKDGFVMSKSRGNIVLPEEVSNKYGIDTARLFLVSVASPDKDIEWNDLGIQGSLRFIKKVFNLSKKLKANEVSKKLETKMHLAIKNITQHINNFNYNLAVIELREFFGYLEKEPNKKAFETFLLLLHPFCPHITEELWSKLGNKSFISLEKWLEFDEKKIDKKILELENIFKKTYEDLNQVIKLAGKKENAYLYFVTDQELEHFNESLTYIKNQFKFKSVKMFKVSDPKKYDPQNKASKAKFGKPGIYLE